jgi:hypothetical protein
MDGKYRQVSYPFAGIKQADTIHSTDALTIH